jgi:hypothetical protein
MTAPYAVHQSSDCQSTVKQNLGASFLGELRRGGIASISLCGAGVNRLFAEAGIVVEA